MKHVFVLVLVRKLRRFLLCVVFTVSEWSRIKSAIRPHAFASTILHSNL